MLLIGVDGFVIGMFLVVLEGWIGGRGSGVKELRGRG
jgi:hypothetical protein